MVRIYAGQPLFCQGALCIQKNRVYISISGLKVACSKCEVAFL